MTRTWFGVAAALVVVAPAVAAAQHYGHDTTAKHEPIGRAAPGGGGHAAAAVPERAVRTVAITVTDEGFVPARVEVKHGERIRFAVTRKTERTCATSFVVKEYGIDQALPFDQTVRVELTPGKAGNVTYGCPTAAITGVLVVQ